MRLNHRIARLVALLLLFVSALVSEPIQASQSDVLESMPGATQSQEPALSLAFVGDVMLARSIGQRIMRDGAAQPFASVREVLRSADITVANLECVIAEQGRPARKAYRFLAPPASVDALTDAGIDLVSLANNHSFDWGEQAFFSMQALLKEKGIASVGAGANATQAYAPQIIERQGIKIAFLAYVNVPVERGGFNTASWTAREKKAGVAWAEPKRIAEDVSAIRAQVDHVIVLLHSGYEGQQKPNAIQRTQANAALQAGARMVIGHHPHMLQGYDLRPTGQLIAWSLGNFVFDGFKGTASLDTAILQVTLDQHSIQSISWIPVRIVDGYPLALDPNGDGARIVKLIEKLPK